MNDSEGSDRLPEESLVDVIVSNGISTKLICTPRHLTDLVTGWLFTQGLVRCCDDIYSLQVCDFNKRVLVQVKQDGASAISPSQILMSSGCSGGKVLESSFRIDGYFCRSKLAVSTSWLVQAIVDMHKLAFTDQCSSGLHCAAIVPQNDAKDIIADSDVGRHNAVDKVIGAALARAVNFEQAVLVTSGRVSSDMVLKAVRAGIPIIATRRSVTTLAAELAEKTGVTVVGRLSRGQPVVVGQRGRLVG